MGRHFIISSKRNQERGIFSFIGSGYQNKALDRPAGSVVRCESMGLSDAKVRLDCGIVETGSHNRNTLSPPRFLDYIVKPCILDLSENIKAVVRFLNHTPISPVIHSEDMSVLLEFKG